MVGKVCTTRKRQRSCSMERDYAEFLPSYHQLRSRVVGKVTSVKKRKRLSSFGNGSSVEPPPSVGYGGQGKARTSVRCRAVYGRPSPGSGQPSVGHEKAVNCDQPSVGYSAACQPSTSVGYIWTSLCSTTTLLPIPLTTLHTLSLLLFPIPHTSLHTLFLLPTTAGSINEPSNRSAAAKQCHEVPPAPTTMAGGCHDGGARHAPALSSFRTFLEQKEKSE